MARKRLNVPNGPGQRRLIGQIAIGQGVAYWAIHLLNRPLTTSYQTQVDIMPLWAWGWMLAVVFTTGDHRRYVWGRLVAIAMLAVQVWFASTFAISGALTAIGMYIPIVVVVFGEAVFIRDWGE